MVNSIKLTAPIKRLDGSNPGEVIVDIDPNMAKKIGSKGIYLPPPGFCAVIDPIISKEAAAKLNPGFPGKQLLALTGIVMEGLDAFSYVFDAAEFLDRHIFKEGVDTLTGLNNTSNAVQNTVRWGERGVLAASLMTAFNYARSRVGTREPLSMGNALASTANQLWNKNKLIAFVFLSATQFAMEPDVIEDTLGIQDPDSRRLGRLGIYGTFWATALYFLNTGAKPGQAPGSDSYRQISPPTARPPLSFGAGAAWATFYFGWMWYWDNWSSQVRYLTTPYGGNHSVASTYNPFTWNFDMTQGRTSAAYSLNWGFTASVWAALHPLSSLLSEGITKRLFGFGREVLKFTAGETASIAGTNILLRPFRIAQLSLFGNVKRFTSVTMQVAAGLPVGNIVNQALARATKYDSKSARVGTTFRTLITSPLGNVGNAINTSFQGYSSSWGSYAYNMIPLNYEWSACAQMPDNLKQVASVLADDYTHATDPQKRREIRTLMYKLYSIAEDNGKTNPKENEKMKLRKVLEDAGINIQGIEQWINANATE